MGLIHPNPSVVDVTLADSANKPWKMATLVGHTQSTECWIVTDLDWSHRYGRALTEQQAEIEEQIPLSVYRARYMARSILVNSTGI